MCQRTETCVAGATEDDRYAAFLLQSLTIRRESHDSMCAYSMLLEDLKTSLSGSNNACLISDVVFTRMGLNGVRQVYPTFYRRAMAELEAGAYSWDKMLMDFAIIDYEEACLAHRAMNQESPPPPRQPANRPKPLRSSGPFCR
jgi:hypothetical protein